MFNLFNFQSSVAFLRPSPRRNGDSSLELLTTSLPRDDFQEQDESQKTRGLQAKYSCVGLLLQFDSYWKSLSMWPHGVPTPLESRSQHGLTGSPSSTSSLDGLRGLAAYTVMNYHILYAYQSFVFYGYGLSHQSLERCGRPEDVETMTNWFHQLPILRLVYSGTWPISVFFIISGFVLSHRVILDAQLSAHPTTSRAAEITSARLLRRPVRLLLPPIVASMFTMILIQLGAYEHGRQLLFHTDLVPVIQEIHHQRMSSIGIQVLDWLEKSWKMCNVFWWGDFHNPYDVHLWTIPVEFRCSLSVFLILPTYTACRPIIRRPLMAAIIAYVYLLDRWDVALFFTGLLTADTSISWHATGPRSQPARSWKTWSQPALIAGRASVLLLSLFLMSSPDLCMEATPGFGFFSQLIPSSDPAPFRFLPNIGGALLVALVTHLEDDGGVVMKLLNSRILQYFGKISFSLYIVHGPLVHTVGYTVFTFVWSVSGTEATWRYVVGFTVGYTILVIAIVWAADLFWRMVDQPSTKAAQLLQGLVSL